MASPIYNISPFTLLDFPDRTACILWFAGCNMRCLYCYNPEIVKGKGKHSYEDALAFLDRRGNLLDGVVMSGGECTMHRGIDRFIGEVKSRGYQVKIDTNGSAPVLLENLIKNNLADYVALDFKALPKSYSQITKSKLYRQFEHTLEILLNHAMPFEVRTTLHSELIPPADLREMVSLLDGKGYTGKYYVQHFVNDTETLSPLPPSHKFRYNEDFSTPDIQVIFRG